MSLRVTFLGVNAEAKGHSCILIESPKAKVLLEPTQRVKDVDAVIITDIDKDEYSEWKYYADQGVPIYSVAAIKRWAENDELREHIQVISNKFSIKGLHMNWLKANVAPHEPAGGVRIPSYDVDIVPELPTYIPQAMIKAFGLPPSHIIVGIGSYKKSDHKISFEDFLLQLEKTRSGKEKGLLSITLTNFRKDLKEHKSEVLRRLKEKWDVPIFWAEKGMTLEFSRSGQVERIDSSNELEKLHLKEFLSKGVDYDIKHVKTRWKECIADLRYLANNAVPRLKAGKKWGEWTLDACYKYFAALVDALRSVYFALVPPTQPELYKIEHPNKDPKEALKTSFWQTYLKAKKYMKSNPPKDEEELKEWNRKRAKLISASEETKSLKVGYLSKAKPYLRFFLPTIHEDIASAGWDEKKLLIDVKADGLRITLWKSGGKGYVFVDPEELKHKSPLINKYVPQIVKEIEEHFPDNTALDGELYAAKGNKALHRTVINGIINTKLPPERFTPYTYAFAFDVLIYKGKDVRDNPLEERLKLLRAFKSTSHIKIEKVSNVVTPGYSGYVVSGNNKSAIDKAIRLIETSKHNLHEGVQEGIMVKTLDHPYEVPTNKGWCLKGGSYILTPDGFMSINQLKSGMQVLSSDGKFHCIKNVFKRKITDRDVIVEINNHYSPKVRLTADHEILTNRGWSKAEEVKSLYSPILNVDILENPPAKIELEMYGYKKTIIPDERFYKLIGFILAEGSLVNASNEIEKSLSHSSKWSGIRISNNEDMTWAIEIIRDILHVQPHSYTYDGKRIVEFKDPPFARWFYDTFVFKHGREHYKHKIRWKTLSIRLPLWFAKITEEQWRSFLEGYWLGDGAKERKYRIGTSSSYMAGTLYLIAKLRGWDATVNWKKTSREPSFLIYISKTPIFRSLKPSIRKIPVTSFHRESDYLYDLEIEGEESYSNGEIVFHNSKCKLWHEVDTVVLDKKLVKGQTDVWNYYLGIEIPAGYAKMMLDDTQAYKRVRCLYNGRLYKKKECQDYLDRRGARFFMEYGKSDNTKIKCDVGDVLRVSSEEVLYNVNETHSEYPYYTGYINRAMEPVPERKTSDNLVVLHRLALLEPQRIPLEVLAKWKENMPPEIKKYCEYIRSLSTSRLIQFYNALKKVQNEE